MHAALRLGCKQHLSCPVEVEPLAENDSCAHAQGTCTCRSACWWQWLHLDSHEQADP